MSGSSREVLDLLRPWVIAGGDPIVVRTSGSTGVPKDVVLSHGAVVASAAATLRRLGGPGGWLSAITASGVGGLQVLVRSVLAEVEPTFLDEHLDLETAIEAIGGDRRYASLVPTQVHRLLRDGHADLLAGLDAVLVGGASMPGDQLAAARDAGITVVRTYGMSETSGGCVYDGVPLEGVKLRLDHMGQVQVSGDVLFDGYAGADPHAGWFDTADLGEIDADGRLHVTGRVDDVVISGGVNVSLPAVTRALRSIGAVADAVALGRPDPEWGAQVVAFLVPGDAVCLDGLRIDEIRDAVEAAGLPRTWAPREVVLLDSLPLLPGGKIDRQALTR